MGFDFGVGGRAMGDYPRSKLLLFLHLYRNKHLICSYIHGTYTETFFWWKLEAKFCKWDSLLFPQPHRNQIDTPKTKRQSFVLTTEIKWALPKWRESLLSLTTEFEWARLKEEKQPSVPTTEIKWALPKEETIFVPTSEIKWALLKEKKPSSVPTT